MTDAAQRHALSPADYDRTWAHLHGLFDAIERDLLPAGGPCDARLLAVLRLFQRYRYFVKPFIAKYGMPVRWDRFFRVVEAKADAAEFAQDLMINGQIVRATIQEKELIYRDLISSAVLAGAAGRADCFVELGSGWSANIFNLWRNGAPDSAAYIGAELSAEGRALAERFARLQTTRDFRSIAFDYGAADFSWLPSERRSLVVFTIYSIEQAELLDGRFFDRLMSATSGFAEVRGVHIEPVAWQYGPAEGDGAEPSWAVAARQQAMWRRHNTNFRQVIEDAAARGVLSVDSVACRSLAAAPEHPGATIRWTRR